MYLNLGFSNLIKAEFGSDFNSVLIILIAAGFGITDTNLFL